MREYKEAVTARFSFEGYKWKVWLNKKQYCGTILDVAKPRVIQAGL
jgi:hypothetical protein